MTGIIALAPLPHERTCAYCGREFNILTEKNPVVVYNGEVCVASYCNPDCHFNATVQGGPKK